VHSRSGRKGLVGTVTFISLISKTYRSITSYHCVVRQWFPYGVLQDFFDCEEIAMVPLVWFCDSLFPSSVAFFLSCLYLIYMFCLFLLFCLFSLIILFLPLVFDIRLSRLYSFLVTFIYFHDFSSPYFSSFFPFFPSVFLLFCLSFFPLRFLSSSVTISSLYLQFSFSLSHFILFPLFLMK
jgi:hypothetical protein